jgi:diaminohydroxyphosphoribosylaminopyrimidine deaminase / 5-amino-6-(5-phosphoribosylamino)uracil reductase
MHPNERYIKRCFQLAINGLGKTYPNPLVGCVIVKNHKIIGEGWHRKAGKAHAEIDALDHLAPGTSAEGATVFVNLEPCSHVGRTPPCANRLVVEKVAKVVICNTDPNPLVAGSGIKILKDAGIEVLSGVLEAEGRELNKRFFHFHEKKRPYIIVKWAESSDGYIASKEGRATISDDLHRYKVHRWRSEEAAILVGSNTAQTDNPELNVRFWTGNSPLRIIIDRKGKLNLSLKIFDQSQASLFLSEQKIPGYDHLQFKMGNEWDWLQQLMDELYQRGVQSILVEGGKEVIEGFHQQGLIDEVRIYTNPELTLGDGISSPVIK